MFLLAYPSGALFRFRTFPPEFYFIYLATGWYKVQEFNLRISLPRQIIYTPVISAVSHLQNYFIAVKEADEDENFYRGIVGKTLRLLLKVLLRCEDREYAL